MRINLTNAFPIYIMLFVVMVVLFARYTIQIRKANTQQVKSFRDGIELSGMTYPWERENTYCLSIAPVIFVPISIQGHIDPPVEVLETLRDGSFAVFPLSDCEIGGIKGYLKADSSFVRVKKDKTPAMWIWLYPNTDEEVYRIGAWGDKERFAIYECNDRKYKLGKQKVRCGWVSGY